MVILAFSRDEDLPNVLGIKLGYDLTGLIAHLLDLLLGGVLFDPYDEFALIHKWRAADYDCGDQGILEPVSDTLFEARKLPHSRKHLVGGKCVVSHQENWYCHHKDFPFSEAVSRRQ